MRGDLRPAYLAWLLAVQAEEVDDDAGEPPVPAGLAELTAAQEAMIEFLRIDVDLVAAASCGSAAATEDGAPFRRWLMALSAKEKDAWLRRAADEPDLALGGELRRAFRATAKSEHAGARRTVGELRALAETHRGGREKAEAARAKKARAATDGGKREREGRDGRYAGPTKIDRGARRSPLERERRRRGIRKIRGTFGAGCRLARHGRAERSGKPSSAAPQRLRRPTAAWC
jgi:hypothetical protein